MHENDWVILLVEDDEDDYVLTRAYLQALKNKCCQLRWVTSVEQALDQLEGNDVILVDYDLGVSSGLDLVREAVKKGCKAPIILLTGQGSYDLDIEAMQMGASDYLTKSDVTPAILERSIRYAIERKRNEDHLRRVQEDLELRVAERTCELQLANQQLESINQELRAEITERARAEQQIAYQANLIENVHDAIIACDEYLILTSWNQAAEEIYGWSADQAIGQPAREFLWAYMDDQQFQQMLVHIRTHDSYQGETNQFSADGRPIRIEYRMVVLKNDAGQIKGYVSVNRDVTHRWQIEAELAEVHRRLLEGREAERLHLAQELHDGPIQTLYGLSFQLANLKAKGLFDPEQADGVQELAHQVIQVLRMICGELRPPTLAPFGLEQTIRSHADHFRRSYPDITLHLSLDADRQKLSERLRLGLFRIYQQAMVNIIRHAEASEITVLFELDGECVHLEVRDNGRGFNVPNRWLDLVREGHLGLAGIAERSEALGGNLNINSSPGKGTIVSVSVPREEFEAAQLVN
jgi:two-component system, cell cycle sensor histidine kinase and response regulator CckA